MIAIIGATGTIGQALLERLRDVDVPVRALSREPGKLRHRLEAQRRSAVEIAAADASDPDSLRRAFAGADQVFFALSNSPDQVKEESAIIQSAAESGVRHLVKISSPLFEPSAPVAVAGWHGEIEKVLKNSGLDYTVLRPYAFMQNLFGLAPTIAAQNGFFGIMGDTPCNFVDCRDIADAAAEVLTRPGRRGGIYTLTGSETYSYPQIASRLSEILNRPIRYIHMEPAELLHHLTERARMPLWLANHVVEIQTLSMKVPERPTDSIKQLLGRAPRTLDAFLQEYADRFR